MNFFEDITSKGSLFKQLQENGLIRKAFDREVIGELCDWGWYEELYNELYDKDELDEGFDRLDALPIYVVYLNEYQRDAIESLIGCYVPLEAVKKAGHFFDFLVVNTDLKLICGMGLGRKNRFFSFMSADGSPFDNNDAANEQLLRDSMPWDFLTKLQNTLEDLGQEMFSRDSIPGNSESLQMTLDAGPNDKGYYYFEDDDLEMLEDELRDYIYDFEIHDENIEDAGSVLQFFFPMLETYDLNTGDY